jgi:hypothetical protein
VLLLCEEKVVGLLIKYRRIDQAPWASRTSICEDMLYTFAKSRKMRIRILGQAWFIEIEESVAAFIVEKANLLFIRAVE